MILLIRFHWNSKLNGMKLIIRRLIITLSISAVYTSSDRPCLSFWHISLVALCCCFELYQKIFSAFYLSKPIMISQNIRFKFTFSTSVHNCLKLQGHHLNCSSMRQLKSLVTWFNLVSTVHSINLQLISGNGLRFFFLYIQ